MNNFKIGDVVEITGNDDYLHKLTGKMGILTRGPVSVPHGYGHNLDGWYWFLVLTTDPKGHDYSVWERDLTPTVSPTTLPEDV